MASIQCRAAEGAERRGIARRRPGPLIQIEAARDQAREMREAYPMMYPWAARAVVRLIRAGDRRAGPCRISCHVRPAHAAGLTSGALTMES